MQIKRRTSQASARRPSSAMMQGCINLWEKPAVTQVGQDLACSHRLHKRTHGAPDPTGGELTVSGPGRDQARIRKTHQEALLRQNNVILAFGRGHARRPALRDNCADTT